MSDSMPVPPPPPPGKKPVPPPPPGKGPMQAAAPASVPAPVPSAVMAPPPMRPMTGMPDPRMQEMEKRFQEQETARKALETQMTELQNQLKDEREKLMMQALKSKEEEALSARVESQLREIQDRLKREKYEQEIQESRGKAEIQLKDIERRLSQERETWMLALKNQLKERETIERDVEQNLHAKLRDLEHRQEEERSRLTQTIRQKEDELHQARREAQMEMDRLQETLEEKEEQLMESRRLADQDKRVVELQAQSSVQDLQNKLDTQMREAANVKVQVSLLQTQIQQLETLRQEERSRAEHLRIQIEKDAQDALRRSETQAQARLDEVQRDALRREMERTQTWEGQLSQARTEKDLIRQMMIHRDEELAEKAQMISDLKREISTDKARHAAEADRVRQEAYKDAERRIPELYGDKIQALQSQWAADHESVVSRLQQQLTRLSESEQAYRLKLDVEEQRAAQETSRYIDAYQEEKKLRESAEQTNEVIQQELTELRTILQEEQARFVAERAKAQEMIQEMQGRMKNERTTAQQSIQELREQLNARQGESQELHDQLNARQLEIQALHEQLNPLQMEIQELREQLNTRQLEMQQLAEQLDRHNQHAQQLSVQLELKTQGQQSLSDDFQSLQSEMQALQKRVVTTDGALAKSLQEMANMVKKENDWSAAYNQIKEAYRGAQMETEAAQRAWTSEKEQMQKQLADRESEWAAQMEEFANLRAQWESDRDIFEQKIQALMDRIRNNESEAEQKSSIPAAVPQSLQVIRQQMQELRATLTWMRSTSQKKAA